MLVFNLIDHLQYFVLEYFAVFYTRNGIYGTQTESFHVIVFLFDRILEVFEFCEAPQSG